MKKIVSIALTALSATALLYGQGKPYLEDLSYYVENLEVFEQNQEEGRAFHIPERNITLNGTWKFQYFGSPADVPGNFFSTSFSDKKWGTIEVPSNWEMQGYGQPVFRNMAAPFPTSRPPEAMELMRRAYASMVPAQPAQSARTSQAAPAAGGGPQGAQARPQQAGAAPGMMTPSAPAFAVTPPHVPMDLNPTGAYRRTFNIPSSWKGDRIFLRFEKVASASFVWVNGKEVGYNEGAQEPCEYDITEYVKTGRNSIAVLVLKYSDGYYLEGQDYWRLAGIFDDVTVYATPQVRIYDWQVITDFDKSYTDSQLSIAVDVKGYDTDSAPYTVKATISKDGKEVAGMDGAVTVGRKEKKTVNLSSTVRSPEKWSSETPSLYDLRLTLVDASGKIVETIDKRIGFKKTEIIDGVFYLNGQPLKVNAQCSHMQHPEMGHAMTEEVIRKDMEILKQFNFNAVRTSHYPPVNEYLDLADEYGLFIIDETGDEAHASEYISYMPEWIPMYQERVKQMVLRDRNHACVLFWSAGNESGEGPNITEVVKEGKKYDPTRYWMYGGNSAVHEAEDIVGPRYPSPLEHEIGYGLDTKDMRPSFMDEYLSVAGNGGGAMDDFWNVIYSHPKLMGGAIWDFVSVGLTEPVRELRDKSPYNTPAHIMGRAKLVAGPTGKAIDLDKQDQWVQVYRAGNVEIAGDKLTLTLDLLPRKYNSSGGYLITKGENQFGLKQNGADMLNFYIDNGSRQTLTADLPSDWEGKWHNVTAIYDGSRMRIIIDGVERASQEMSGSIRNLPLSVCIGRSEEALGQETNVYVCDAIIDNVGIFAEAVEPGYFDPSKAALWLDFEEETENGTFWSYGIGARTYGSIWPDRVPQPEMWQMKKTTQPLSFKLIDASKGTVEVWNRNHFLNASHYKTSWTLTEDNDVIASGQLDLDVEPLSRELISIPLTRPQPVPGKEYRLNISSVLAEDEVWAPAGHEVSWDQFELMSWNVPAAEPGHIGTARLSENGNILTVSGNAFSYSFDKSSGNLLSMIVDGKEMLSSPVTLNVWRAPLANELDGWNSRSAGQVSATGYGANGHSSVLASHYYAAGLDNLGHFPINVQARQAGDDVTIDVRELSLLGGGRSQVSQLDAYISGRSYNGFENIYNYVIHGDGTLELTHTVHPQGTMPAWLPRLGVTMRLDKSLAGVEWYGRGPQASYPDRKTGYRIGIWSSDVDSMYEPYLMPQDYGLRTDNRWVRFTDEDGHGLEFSMDQPFAFNAYDCTTENLTKSVFQYQLVRGGDITLNLDYATSGVGCTARGIFDSYRVYPAGYTRTISIKPIQ